MPSVVLEELTMEFMVAKSTGDTAECYECGARMYPDDHSCVSCGWRNPLEDLGLIR